jgi:signal peptidase I
MKVGNLQKPSPWNPGRLRAACSEPVLEESRQAFIKRIVAGPGDVISIVDGHVIRDGTREADSYTLPCRLNPQCSFPTPIKIRAGYWFMMNDNRGESDDTTLTNDGGEFDDSTFWGPVPTAWIVGEVVNCSFFHLFCSNAYAR